MTTLDTDEYLSESRAQVTALAGAFAGAPTEHVCLSRGLVRYVSILAT